MKILALDPAATTGFYWSDNEHRVYGSWQITSRDDTHPGARLERLRSHIYRVHRERGIERIAYEDAALGSHHFQTQGLHAELRGIIKLAAKELSIECIAVNPATLKKWATGHGHAKKPQMIAAVKSLYGIDVAGDDNAADAILIGEFARQPKLPVPVKVKKRRIAKAAKKEARLF